MSASNSGALGRRDFLKVTTGATAAMGLPAVQVAKAAEHAGPYNVILVITDQESHRLLAGADYHLPARDALARRATSFEQHYIGAAMCTPSRGVMFSGQPPQVNGVFDQMELGYVPSLSSEQPSLGTVMKALGYATAYYGKFELLRDIITPSDQINYTEALKPYGFDHFAPDGDKVGAPDQGYDTDKYTAAAAVRWMRTNGRKLNARGQPWFLVVSFVSPHDIMYADANIGGSLVQASKIGATITAPPDNSLFKASWRFPLSPSHGDPIGGPGRPGAQMQYHRGWSDFLGEIPGGRDDMWRYFYTYYLNLIRDNDRTMQMLLDAFDELDLWRDSVIVRTADHGELAGSHGGLRGKGPFPYEEMAHVPFLVAHPAHTGGRRCQALTSHIDLLPTLAGLTGLPEARRLTAALPGRDASGLLDGAEQAAPDALRPGVLFNYVGLQTIEADYLAYIACKSIVEGKWVPSLAKVHPDLSKRGFINFTFDGRYKFARYYAPADFNRPTSLEEILADNDIELFDLQTDPFERTNLALEPKANEATILRLNKLLNRLLAQEVGANDGRFLPAPVRPGA